MSDELEKLESLDLSLAHILTLRELLTSKLAEAPANGSFSEIERRAIWILEDEIDRKLIQLGVKERLPDEWDALTKRAHKKLQSQPCDFF